MSKKCIKLTRPIYVNEEYEDALEGFNSGNRETFPVVFLFSEKEARKHGTDHYIELQTMQPEPKDPENFIERLLAGQKVHFSEDDKYYFAMNETGHIARYVKSTETSLGIGLPSLLTQSGSETVK